MGKNRLWRWKRFHRSVWSFPHLSVCRFPYLLSHYLHKTSNAIPRDSSLPPEFRGTKDPIWIGPHPRPTLAINSCKVAWPNGLQPAITRPYELTQWPRDSRTTPIYAKRFVNALEIACLSPSKRDAGAHTPNPMQQFGSTRNPPHTRKRTDPKLIERK